MKGKLKKWLKEKGKNALGVSLDLIGENTSIPVVSKVLEGIGESLKNDPDLTPEEKAQAAELIKAEINERIEMEKQISERWKADMSSDNWLSKNVRPMILVYSWFLLTLMMVLAFFSVELPDNYVNMFEVLAVAVTGGYFALRTAEKRNRAKYR